MDLAVRKITELTEVENKVFFIYHCEYTIKSFFEDILIGSKVEDECVLYYEGREYGIDRLTEIGVELQRDIRMYKLTPLQPAPKDEKSDGNFLNIASNAVLGDSLPQICEGCSNYKEQCKCLENSKNEFKNLLW